jgi:hypothetical protein
MQKGFYERIIEELKISNYAFNSFHLVLDLSLSSINNPKTDYLIADKCAIMTDRVVCGNYSIKRFSDKYEEEIV